VTLVTEAKKLLRQLMPRAVLDERRRRVREAFEREYADRSPQESFSAIYRRGLWGEGRDRFYSGPGSHHAPIVDDYVDAVAAFLRGLPAPARVVDLGCGDFNTGRRLSPLCASTIACDVVPALIERNRATFPDVDFRCLDITSDPLPAGDVAIVRQVLQHLSNAHIAQVVPKLRQYRHVVLTEHVPDGDFAPNLDKPTGLDVRLDREPQSGVVVTRAPFDLAPRSERVLCDVRGFGGVIRTMLYTMR